MFGDVTEPEGDTGKGRVDAKTAYIGSLKLRLPRRQTQGRGYRSRVYMIKMLYSVTGKLAVPNPPFH